MNRRTCCSIALSCLAGAALGSPRNAVSADAVTQCIAANEDSLTLRKEGRLLDARRALAACAATSCPEAIRQACRDRIPDLNRSIPSVVFDVKDASGYDLVDVTVSVDGQPGAPVRATAVALDPGRHVFRFERGQASVELDVVLREGQKDQPVAVVLTETPPSKSASIGAAGVRAAATSTETVGAGEPVGRSPLTESNQRTLGWVTGGAGIAVLAAGEILAFVAKSSYDGVVGCAGTTCDNQTAVDTRNSARELGNVATGFVAAGGALMAAGLIVWITAPRGGVAGKAPSWRAGVTLGGAAGALDF